MITQGDALEYDMWLTATNHETEPNHNLAHRTVLDWMEFESNPYDKAKLAHYTIHSRLHPVILRLYSDTSRPMQESCQHSLASRQSNLGKLP